MKKKIVLFLIFCLCLIPATVLGEGISNYYIDATIEINGDLKVKEVFTLTGSYNGMERIIYYANKNTADFDPDATSYGGSKVYNGTGITIDKIGSIASTNINEYSINSDITSFSKSTEAHKGDYALYTEGFLTNGVDLLIYNPSSYENSFYVEYTLKDMAVKWNDIGELGWTVFGTQLSESVDNMVIYVHIPGNKTTTRVWSHGPLTGSSQIVDANTLKVVFPYLDAYTAIDVRCAFDRSVIAESSKIENYNALDKIIAYETVLADEANAKRATSEQEVSKNAIVFGILLPIAVVIWIVVLIIVLKKYYDKYIKSLKPNFTQQYFRDFPSEDTPATISYLVYRNIESKALSASILELIRRKVITSESVDKTYKFKLNVPIGSLNGADEALVRWMFYTVGNGTEVTLKEFKEIGTTSYEKFFTKYQDWIDVSEMVAKTKNYYSNDKKIGQPLGITLLGFLLIFFALAGLGLEINTLTESIIFICIVVIIIAILVGFIFIGKPEHRTQYGTDEKAKWDALKNFMNDFGTFKDRNLPDIILWEKYLVYATLFGCASKLQKEMEIKYQEIIKENSALEDSAYYDMLNYWNMSDLIDDAVRASFRSANFARVNAASSSDSSFSSGGGFGGGSSGSGGSFGGGGGGGRF